LALESATYINSLNVSNPAATDNLSQADDHIRMLKQVLKATFPNIAGAVTPTHTQFNQALVPIGGIIMWSGSAASVPTGWRLCDGGTVSRSDGSGNITVPDLRNKFILGCGGSTALPTATPAIGDTGGAETDTPTITVTVNGHSITQAELPNVSFTGSVTDPGHSHGVTDPGHAHYLPSFNNTRGAGSFSSLDPSAGNYPTTSATTGISVNSATTGISVSVPSGGSGTAHTHTATGSSSAVDTVPPYYTLAFICKT
jgi:hypothetical protein